MLTTDFSFNLPEELIAQKPVSTRGLSRLLVLDRLSGLIKHSSVNELNNFIPSDAVMVFNDSKVRKARLFAKTLHGGTVELLLLRQEYGQNGKHLWAALSSRMSRMTLGKKLYLPDKLEAEVVEQRRDERLLLFSKDINDDYLEQYGHLPLPPYIKREDNELDTVRYQTIYAKEYGSSAAPTAGLHFTAAIMEGLKALGIKICFVTLHVGLGTFLPVRSQNVEAHKMHYEDYVIPADTATLINNAKQEKRPVIAVGTTSVRTLESAWTENSIRPGAGSTDIFIYPGYNFSVVDGLFTNFHTPESTLLMLVSAFAGKENIFKAYKEAIDLRYSFFSYGDAMFIK